MVPSSVAKSAKLDQKDFKTEEKRQKDKRFHFRACTPPP